MPRLLVVATVLLVAAGFLAQPSAAGSARVDAVGPEAGLNVGAGLPAGPLDRNGWGPGAEIPAQVTATPTRTPPEGSWSVMHGPNYEPLWPAIPPALRAVHGTWSNGEWIGYAVGEDGAFARFDGSRWQTGQVGAPAGGGAAGQYQLKDVFVAAPDDVWMVGTTSQNRFCGECGVVIHYDGTRFLELSNSDIGVIGRVSPLNAIDMVQDTEGNWHGWIVGDDAAFDNIKAIILRYQDGEWDLWSGPNNIAKDLYDVRILSPQEAWAVGEDGSESWFNEAIGNGGRGWPRLGHSGVDTLYAVDLADPLFGWDGGVGGRMNHYSGTCHDNTNETQCWFDNEARPVRNSSGLALNLDVHAIDLLSRTDGWLVGNPSGRTSLVAYLNGKRWLLSTVQGDPGRVLYGLHMVGFGAGFAVGDDGVILRFDGPGGLVPPTATPTNGTPGTPGTPVTPTPSTGTPDTATPEASLTPGTPGTGTTATPGTPETGTPETGTPVSTEITPTVSQTQVSPTPTVTPTESPVPSSPTASPSTTPSATLSPTVPASATSAVGHYRLYCPIVVTNGR